MLEHFEREVLHGAVARRRPVEAAGRRLGERDHVGHGLRLDRLVDHQQIGDERGEEDRLEVPDRVVRQIGIERRIHRVGGGVVHDGVAVAIRLGHRRGGDGAAGAAAIVDDELLAPHVAELLEQDAAHRVGAARRRIGNHHLDRPRRIGGLRRGGWRATTTSGSAPAEAFNIRRRVSPRRPCPMAFPRDFPALPDVRRPPIPFDGCAASERMGICRAEPVFRPFPIIAEAPYFGDGESSRRSRTRRRNPSGARKPKQARARSGQAFEERSRAADARQGRRGPICRRPTRRSRSCSIPASARAPRGRARRPG